MYSKCSQLVKVVGEQLLESELFAVFLVGNHFLQINFANLRLLSCDFSRRIAKQHTFGFPKIFLVMVYMYLLNSRQTTGPNDPFIRNN